MISSNQSHSIWISKPNFETLSNTIRSCMIYFKAIDFPISRSLLLAKYLPLILSSCCCASLTETTLTRDDVLVVVWALLSEEVECTLLCLLLRVHRRPGLTLAALSRGSGTHKLLLLVLFEVAHFGRWWWLWVWCFFQNGFGGWVFLIFCEKIKLLRLN